MDNSCEYFSHTILNTYDFEQFSTFTQVCGNFWVCPNGGFMISSCLVVCVDDVFDDHEESESPMNTAPTAETQGQQPSYDDFIYELLAEMRLP